MVYYSISIISNIVNSTSNMVSDKISEKSNDVQDETDNFVLTEILNSEEEIAEKKNKKLAKWIFVASTFLITATTLGVTVDLNHCVSLKNLTDYKSLRTEFLKDNTKCLYNRTLYINSVFIPR